MDGSDVRRGIVANVELPCSLCGFTVECGECLFGTPRSAEGRKARRDRAFGVVGELGWRAGAVVVAGAEIVAGPPSALDEHDLGAGRRDEANGQVAKVGVICPKADGEIVHRRVVVDIDRHDRGRVIADGAVAHVLGGVDEWCEREHSGRVGRPVPGPFDGE